MNFSVREQCKARKVASKNVLNPEIPEILYYSARKEPELIWSRTRHVPELKGCAHL